MDTSFEEYEKNNSKEPTQKTFACYINMINK